MQTKSTMSTANTLPDQDTLRTDFLRFYGAEDGGFVGSDMAREVCESPRQAVFGELAKIELRHLGQPSAPFDPAAVRDSCAFVRDRYDCADFTLAALLRLLYRYQGTGLLGTELEHEIEEIALTFKYWITEPGQDVMCYWTENHQALFATAELLAGQLFPDRTFANNGQTGRQHAAHAIAALRKWLDWRVRYGFSEWLSNCYYDEDLLALANLVDYAQDEAIRDGARRVIDLILFDVAVHSYRGTFGATHGRAYMRDILPAVSPVSAVTSLYWGAGTLERMSLSAMLLASSAYRAPEVVRAIAWDRPKEMEARARHSLTVDDAIARGLDPSPSADLMFFWGAQERQDRRVIDGSLSLCPPDHYLTPRLRIWRDHYELSERTGQPYDPDPDASANVQADVHTYRTPDYQLSCVQDYRPAKVGFQQHIWQATLGGDAPEDKVVVFTTHPGTEELRGRPSYWTGNTVLPRALAYKNVLLCFYWIQPQQSTLWYTHAFFPWQRFDETAERGGWLFGRKGDGYVALRSLRPSHWADPAAKSVLPGLTTGDRSSLNQMAGRQTDLGPSGPPPPYDRIALGHRNVWVCELGRPAPHGSFADFVQSVSAARLDGDEWQLAYTSPSVGLVEAGWTTPLRVAGREIPLHDYPRFDNPYAQAPFGATDFILRHGDLAHTITHPALPDSAVDG